MNTIIKKCLKVFSCLALTLSIKSGVQASSSEAFLRANQLYSLCSSEVKLDNAVCEGYFIGVNDAVFSGHLSNIFQLPNIQYWMESHRFVFTGGSNVSATGTESDSIYTVSMP